VSGGILVVSAERVSAPGVGTPMGVMVVSGSASPVSNRTFSESRGAEVESPGMAMS